MRLALPMIGLAAATATPAAAQVMTGPQYVATAGASDLYERQSAQVVLETTQDPQVRAFATMMLQAHQQSTDRVAAAARRARLRVSPPTLTPVQAEMIAQLRAERGPARDAAYIAQQRGAHNQALDVQKAYAAGGTVVPLRTAAAGIVPVVQQHIAMLMRF